ncbi:hypothetical protein NEOLEDRAFT_1241149 [Neolentinus lepideus HHB14362 ss-1]|uniref:Uncharacterized protein n=1 Tax=Neolentinus lepideus HHB14362 ss-1 TaxID=1314782 RepID=A0A165T840_9AGAM|nr:hypothetical protein NEOLEDRAFT_1241149 [Neolentinus lepideus HHB14362 ss-1]
MAASVFLKVRGVSFAVMTFISLLWIVLLCLEIFLRWDVSDVQERSFAVLLLIVNTITIIMLPLLILTRFRVWLDAARLFFLLMAHIGVAISYVLWSPRFQCPDETPDQQGVCMLINMYILIASWINPAFLLAYSFFLIVVVYRFPHLLLDMQSTAPEDPEKPPVRASTLPMQQADGHVHATALGICDSSQRMKELLDAVFSDDPSTPVPDPTSLRNDHRKSAGSSGRRDRLSKPVPIKYV